MKKLRARCVLPVPDPAGWPADPRRWFLAAIGERGPLDIFFFDFGEDFLFAFFEDAVTCLGVFDVLPSEWSVSDGYAVFRFHRRLLRDLAELLSGCGLRPFRVSFKDTPVTIPGSARRIPFFRNVVDIAAGQDRRQQQRHSEQRRRVK